ncbi:hypothetical protein Dsin_009029 [Dipteronia sinensis]|uniref:RNase H type-1 domain-containing protein n=1 Tax=Dipteronia sinensis TaxID=43782 RepID=A0AAE0AR14_9ROSI|nr:hypothetical protein Dsin_009029 [Dipteronia sinensis]
MSPLCFAREIGEAQASQLVFPFGKSLAPLLHNPVEEADIAKQALALPLAMSVSFSDQVRVLWKVAIHIVVWSVWIARNQWIFEGKAVNFMSALALVCRAVSNANRLKIGCMSNCVDDLLILRRFGLRGCPTKALVFAFDTDILAASLAINFSWKYGWRRIWLESDSSYVVQLLSSRSVHNP